MTHLEVTHFTLGRYRYARSNQLISKQKRSVSCVCFLCPDLLKQCFEIDVGRSVWLYVGRSASRYFTWTIWAVRLGTRDIARLDAQVLDPQNLSIVDELCNLYDPNLTSDVICTVTSKKYCINWNSMAIILYGILQPIKLLLIFKTWLYFILNKKYNNQVLRLQVGCDCTADNL